MKWEEVKDIKEKGGLEIYSIRDGNHALRCKWLWRFSSERKALWRKVLVARYGEEDLGGWRLGRTATREGSLVVRALVRLGNGDGRIREAFHNGIRVLVGKGDRISFQNCTGGPLMK